MGEKVFFIKQKPLSIKVRYEILDQKRKKVYEIVGSFLGGNFAPMSLIDDEERELIWIKKTPFKFFPRYELYDSEGVIGIVKRKIGFFKKKIILETSEDSSYEFRNNYRMDDCQLSRDGKTIAIIRRRGFSAWRTYELKIDEQEDVEFILSLASAVDQIFIWSHRS
ncbi:MAG: LURP-one-related family protein [Bacteroidia bacterium]|nr:LURP-one-related family protein [Bacteroidia bacterium]